eukprot:471490-Amphidinium_carterae.1
MWQQLGGCIEEETTCVGIQSNLGLLRFYEPEPNLLGLFRAVMRTGYFIDAVTSKPFHETYPSRDQIWRHQLQLT